MSEKYQIVKSLIATGSPIDGVTIDIAYNVETDIYTYIVYSDNLRNFRAEDGAAVMRWLYHTALRAQKEFGIKVGVAREAHA